MNTTMTQGQLLQLLRECAAQAGLKSKFNLAEWQHRHGHTYESAAKALGVCRAEYARYLKQEREGKPLPKMLVMACRFIDQEAACKK